MLTAAVSSGVGWGMDSASRLAVKLPMAWFRNSKISRRCHQFSGSRILLLDLMFTSSQMNTETLINFLYIILLILNLWKLYGYYKFDYNCERKQRLSSY